MRTTGGPARAEPGDRAGLRGRAGVVGRVIEAVGAGPGAVLRGPGGMGRTSVLAAVRERLAAAGARVLEIRPMPPGSRPFAALVPLLGVDLPASVDVGSLGAVGDTLAGQGREASSLVLLVDDLDQLDDAVAAVVHQVVATGAARLVASVALGGPSATSAPTPWWWDVATRIELGPLDRADGDAVAADLVGGPLDARSAEWVWAAARGHPGRLVALVDATRAEGGWVRRAGLWALEGEEAPRAGDDLLARLDGLDPEVRHALEVLALVGPLAIEDAEALGAAALVGAEREGLLRTDVGGDGELWCAVASRIVAATLRLALDAEDEVDRWERALRVLSGSADTSPHTALAHGRAVVGAGRAGPAASHEDLDAVLAGALAARTLSRWEQSAALAGAAWRARPGAEALTCLTMALGVLGDHDAIRALSAEVDAVEADATSRAHHASTIAISQFHSDDAAGAFATTARARRTAPEDARPQVDVVEARLRSFAGDHEAALALVEPWCTEPVTGVRIEAMAVRASVAAMRGRTEEAIVAFDEAFALAVALPDLPVSVAGTPHLLGLSARVEAGRMDEALRGVEAVLDEAMRSGDAAGRGWLALHLGRCRLVAGRPQAAAALFAQAVHDLRPLHRPGWLGYPAAALVAAHAAAGDLAAAASARAEWAEIPAHAAEVLRGEELRMVAWLDAAEGRAGAAASILAEAARRAGAVGAVPYEVAALHDLVRLDGGDGRVQGADGLARLAAGASNPLVQAHAAQAAAMLSGDPGALAAVAADYEAMGYLLDARETWAEVGRRAGDEHQQALARRRSAELAVATAGLATPLLGAGAAPSVLTRREREIADLVAAGTSRQAVADHLFVSVRTIDSHLQRIYRKLGVRGRRDLVEALGELGPRS